MERKGLILRHTPLLYMYLNDPTSQVLFFLALSRQSEGGMSENDDDGPMYHVRPPPLITTSLTLPPLHFAV